MSLPQLTTKSNASDVEQLLIGGLKKELDAANAQTANHVQSHTQHIEREKRLLEYIQLLETRYKKLLAEASCLNAGTGLGQTHEG